MTHVPGKHFIIIEFACWIFCSKDGMLYLIGLGLGDAKDISVKGVEVVRNAKEVYLEAYTSILTVGKDALVRSMMINFLLIVSLQ